MLYETKYAITAPKLANSRGKLQFFNSRGKLQFFKGSLLFRSIKIFLKAHRENLGNTHTHTQRENKSTMILQPPEQPL